MSGQLTESRFDYLIEHIDSLSDSEKAELLIAIGFNTTCNYRKQAEKLVLQLGGVSNIMGVALMRSRAFREYPYLPPKDWQ